MAHAGHVADLHRQQRQAILAFAREPRNHAGRGIVTSIFDRHFPSAWVMLSELARLGVQLPIEVFHRPNELSPGNAALAGSLGLNLKLRLLTDPVTGYAVKPYSIWRSSFREVLWLDADNFPLRDPAFLFDDPEYRAKGSLFWRDVSGADRAVIWHPQSPVWAVFNVQPNDAEEFETGQLLLDKEKCWPELGLTLHLNEQHAIYYSYVMGDKDTFRLAWQNLAAARKTAPPGRRYLSDPDKVPYGFMPFGPFHMGQPNKFHQWGGGSVMVQRDREGLPLFVHRNMQKFRLTEENAFNTDVPNEALYHGHIDRLRTLLRLSPPSSAAVPA